MNPTNMGNEDLLCDSKTIEELINRNLACTRKVEAYGLVQRDSTRVTIEVVLKPLIT